jgi:hypothetical protein
MNFEQKALYFLTALQDVYRDEENKESINIKLDLEEETLTEDFTAMIYALYLLYREITGDDTDIIGFTHICNRLAIQHALKEEG